MMVAVFASIMLRCVTILEVCPHHSDADKTHIGHLSSMHISHREALCTAEITKKRD
jgi:hypothetical protein